MKKYLIIALAAFGLAACAKDDLADGNKPIHGGEIEESYIAINLATSENTRAEGEYVDGATTERAVQKANFFFFKDGAPFPVNVTDDTVTSPGGTINHLSTTLSVNADNTDNNVSDVTNVVLLISNYKGEYPNQIVAVLNWNPEIDKAYYLSELETEVNLATKYNSQDYFVMSNAVYAAGNIVMKATPLTDDNIKTTQSDAEDNPVTIYVERVAAKVTVTTADGSTMINLRKPVNPIGGVQTDVYAKLLGWELHNDIPQSYLLKHIDPTWDDVALGFTWNDAPWYRSYWATSLPLPTPSPVVESFKMSYADDEMPAGFATEYGFAIGNNAKFGTAEETAKSFTYVGENTNGKDQGTKVILKAQLVDVSGNALDIASWYGNQYIGENDLLTAVANTLKYTLFYKSGDNYVGIEPDDLMCVAGGTAVAPSGVAANEVYFQLSTTKPGAGANRANGWYKLVNGEYKTVASDLSQDANSVNATNNYLKTLDPGIIYKNGETFYYVDIKHLGKRANPSVAVDGEYGVVRNHIYNIIINSIGGYGSPIYIGNSNLITPEYPELPDAQESFVSAQVKILSWRLVDQQVDIQK
ncbi:MAG: Mfa1 family fimbria major subunit [Alistipes sp.]|nr:Mfa1 family fimbria major subunit [Alistipes sp.]